MSSYEAIAADFQQILELVSVSVDELVEPLERAAEVCNQALLGEHKILCCGNGPGAAVAQLFSVGLVHRFDQERPALPAVNLAGDGAALTAIPQNVMDAMQWDDQRAPEQVPASPAWPGLLRRMDRVSPGYDT